MSDTVTTLADLEALYPEPPNPRSLQKEMRHVDDNHRRLIEASPFCILATSGPGGLDASPRGDAPGFVQVLDPTTLILPDRPGNNRIDTLRNIAEDPRVGLLFLIPGRGETVRVNGRAQISTRADLLDRCVVAGKRPRSVLVISVEAVYFQCSRAVVRADLWNPEAASRTADLPTAGQLLAGADPSFDGAAYDRDLPQRVRGSLYG